MTERANDETEAELSPEQREQIQQAIASVIEFYPEPQDHDLPGPRIVDMNPMNLTEGEDERLFQQLDEPEKEFIRNTLFEQLEPKVEESREVEVPNLGPGREVIYRTNQDGTYLHEVVRVYLNRPETVDFFLSDRNFILQ